MLALKEMVLLLLPTRTLKESGMRYQLLIEPKTGVQGITS